MVTLRDIPPSDQPSQTILVTTSEWNDVIEGKKDIVFGFRGITEEDIGSLEHSLPQDVQLDLVALAVCDPNDMTRAHPDFTRPNHDLRQKLKASTIERIYIEYEKFIVETSPVFPEASDEELLELGRLLIIGEKLAQLTAHDVEKARRLRKRALLLLEELQVGG